MIIEACLEISKIAILINGENDDEQKEIGIPCFQTNPFEEEIAFFA